MYCDRSAYYQKAIKATARQLKINTYLRWLFLLFGRLGKMPINKYNYILDFAASTFAFS